MIKRLFIASAVFFALVSASGAATAAEACSSSWGGKYTGYVLKMHVPEDRHQYGACNDYGRWNGTAYKGRQVPRGSFWVYKYPYWYVWRVRGYRIRHHGGRVFWIGASVK